MTSYYVYTARDAETSLDGMREWEFSPSGSYKALCAFVSRNSPFTHVTEEQLSRLVAAYLVSIGEDPADYGVTA